MRYLLLLLILTAAPISAYAQTDTEKVIRANTEQMLMARKSRNSAKLRQFYDPAEIKTAHDFLRFNYLSIKEDIKKGVFPPAYVRRSIEDSDFGDAYKKAFLNYLFKNGNLDRDLDSAFSQYLVAYEYNVASYQIDKIEVDKDGVNARAYVTEYRANKGVVKPQAVSLVFRWQRKNNNWYLPMDRPGQY